MSNGSNDEENTNNPDADTSSDAKPKRYSEERLTHSLSVTVLLSEPLTYRNSEIIEALREEFPTLRISDFTRDDTLQNTGSVVIGVYEATNNAWVSLSAFPTRMEEIPVDHMARFSGDFPEFRAAVDRHQSAITISSLEKKTDLVSRFVAMRDVACISAIFAGLPIATGVYFPSADRIIKPQTWIDGAHQACRDEWPIDTWIGYSVQRYANPSGGPALVSSGTMGMAAFNGVEISLSAAPMHPVDAGKHVLGAVWMLLQAGHTFLDGDTLGIEDSDQRLRLRFMREEKLGPPGSHYVDTWFILHPDSVVDEMEMFGPRPHKPSPSGVNANKSDSSVFKRALGIFGSWKGDKTH